jgi:Amt family ammonium transporter
LMFCCGALLLTPPAWSQDEKAAADTQAAETKAEAAEEKPAATEETPAAPMEEAAAEPATDPVADLKFALDTVWTMVAAFLVMWMQAGFALVETGLTRAKNAVNICMKNLLDFCFGSIGFWAIGFGLMFSTGNDYIGTDGFFLQETKTEVKQEDGTMKEVSNFDPISWANIPLNGKFFFQMVFAATAATIVSGAMAERTKFTSYMVYSVIISICIYPVSGHWIWGGGWLADKGFWDFAGSTVVHSLGGWLALAGALILGPRKGKYTADGRAKAIPGHNLVYVALGVFILWLGWFGFNPGSTMGAAAEDICRVTCTTNAAAAVGGIAALVTAYVMFGKWEATMALNGVLAGLVAITAPCYWISIEHSCLVGLGAGVLVVLSVVFIDQTLKIDDPVGAISVHGVCGAFGTLCVGLFSTGNGDLSPKLGLFNGGGMDQLMIQLTGVGAVAAWGIGTGAICFLAIKYTLGLRVTEEEELEGLDVGEHGNEAYSGFLMAPKLD